MPRRHLHAPAADGTLLRDALRRLRVRLDVPEEFPAAVLAEARQAAGHPRMPELDATGIPLLTIDPPTSTDLDQAMHLAARADGYRVHYAIADVAAFVTPGGAIDAEAHRRVTTLYFPDERVPLHPQVLSEGAASLLPGQDRPALLWRIDLDAAGSVTAADVRRARVRSRAKLDYAAVQRSIDAGTAEEPVALLQKIGLLREELERDRGGISLNVPEQEIEQRPDGDGYVLDYRAPLPAEGWNAQISLLTGMAAADLMLRSGAGILRTLPAAPAAASDRLRRVAEALRIDWPAGTPYPDVIRSLDPHRPDHAAFLQECTSLLRGAGYTVFDGAAPAPEHAEHAAVAAPYTHCTAPLRRLVDRYAGEICLSAVAGEPLPDWVRTALPDLPREMSAGTQHANQAERECVNLIEAVLLKDRVGEVFDAFVIDLDDRDPTSGTIHLKSPAVVARVKSVPPAEPLPLGHPLPVRLTAADPATPTVLFAPAGQPDPVD
ncbi:RNB domain-containing ribonuclease [Streptomyces sp. H39-S7]|uniref:RNB domain-containing ribonuclease n=1 Tax=Streptomyces sp. H39-S7 TaxID=3004357 RepID=UPI0022AF64BD|nr:RNB domain-containing ribonuclease [Streptomyces sp. H39-S7]MCZ4122651.1 RNB domain-containing ribonuclease [Streptomyces sp. H39-S7]